jgi:ribonuclease PH
MNGTGDFIEVQGTAEGHPFSQDELDAMLALARQGIDQLLAEQRRVLEA